MRKSKFLVLLMVFGAIVSGLFGETTELTIDRAVELAIENSLSLQSQDFRLEAKKRSRDFSWNAFLPDMSVGFNLSRMNEAPSTVSGLKPINATGGGVYSDVYSYSVDPDHYWNVSASFSASLYISLALFDGIKHTILDYEAGVISRANAEKQLVRDVKKQFYNLILLQEEINNFEKTIETTQDRYDQEKRNYEAGLGSEFEMLSAQVGLENLKPVLANIENGYQIALLQFKQFLGLGSEDAITINGTINFSPAEVEAISLDSDTIEMNPDVMALRKAIEIQKNLKVADFNRTFTPSLILQFSMDPTFNALKDPFSDPWFEDVEDDWSQRSGMFLIGVQMPLDDLLPFSSKGVSLSNMDSSIKDLETQLLMAIQGTEVQIQSLVLSLQKSLKSIETLELNVRLAQKAFEMAEKGYQSGAFERLEVEDAEDSLNEARLAVNREKYAYLSALFDLEYAVNSDLQ